MNTCTVCGTAPARGPVEQIGDVPAHTCRQCEQHCEMARYLHDNEVAAAR